jgi:hypothetical protein
VAWAALSIATIVTAACSTTDQRATTTTTPDQAEAERHDPVAQPVATIAPAAVPAPAPAPVPTPEPKAAKGSKSKADKKGQKTKSGEKDASLATLAKTPTPPKTTSGAATAVTPVAAASSAAPTPSPAPAKAATANLAPYNKSGTKPVLPEDVCPPAPVPPETDKDAVYANVPFKAGERAVYEVKYAGVLAGHAEIEVRAPTKVDGQWHRVFHATAKTGDWYKAIFVMEDEIQAVSRPWDFGIARFFMKQDEGKLFSRPFRQEKRSEFDHTHCHVVEKTQPKGKPEETKETYLVTGANDALGAYFNLRARNFVAGRTEYAPVFTSEKNWLLEATPLGVESVTVKAGTFKAMKMRLQTFIGQELQQKGDVFLWMAVDHPERPLVQVQAEIKVGSIWIELKEFQPGA